MMFSPFPEDVPPIMCRVRRVILPLLPPGDQKAADPDGPAACIYISTVCSPYSSSASQHKTANITVNRLRIGIRIGRYQCVHKMNSSKNIGLTILRRPSVVKPSDAGKLRKMRKTAGNCEKAGSGGGRITTLKKFYDKHHITVDNCFELLYTVYRRQKGGTVHEYHFEQFIHDPRV